MIKAAVRSAVVAALYCASVAGAPQHIIDAHIHLFDPNKPGGIPWPSPGDPIYKTTLPADYKKIADPLKITGAVVVECSDAVNDNQWELDLIKDDSTLCGFIGNLAIGSSNFDADLNKFSANKKFLGLRHYPSSLSQGAVDDLKALAQKGMVLELWNDANLFNDAKAIAQKAPDLPILIDHAGNTTVDGKSLSSGTIASINAAAAITKIHCKVSSLFKLSRKNPAPIDVAFYTPLLDVLFAAFGPDRLIFGSDWPALELNGRTFADELNIVVTYFSAKGDSVLQKVLWKNAIAFYHLPLTLTHVEPGLPACAPSSLKSRIVRDRSGTAIEVGVGGNETIDLSVYRLNGANVVSSRKTFERAGVYRISLTGKNGAGASFPGGIYICKVSSPIGDRLLVFTE